MRRTVLMAMGLLLFASCGGDDDGTSSNLGSGVPESIVVLGDSIASGEGINYGYTYQTSFPNRWIGGTDNPTWQGMYQLCHQSEQAYGDLVAAALGAKLAKFACTGTTYDNGMLYDRRYGELYRPAQFGDWLSMSNINPDYDTAAPDAVIITLGADDLQFVDIVTYCATGFTLADAEEVDSIARDVDPGARIRAAFLERYPTIEAIQQRPQSSSSDYCTAANPGAPIEQLFWDPIRSGEIAGHYKDLVIAIQERGMKAGKVPKIVFTTYTQPLPGPDDSDDCLDMIDLSRDETNYLISLEQTLNQTIIDTLSGMPGVSVADISGVMEGHEFCTTDPWSYGLTVLELNDDSKAPFHPTPMGQAAIAAIVQKQFVVTDN